MVNFTALHLLVGRYIFNLRDLLREYFWVLTSFVFMVLVLVVADRMLAMLPLFLRMLCQIVALMVVYFPFLMHINKKYDVWPILKEKFLRSRRQKKVTV